MGAQLVVVWQFSHETASGPCGLRTRVGLVVWPCKRAQKNSRNSVRTTRPRGRIPPHSMAIECEDASRVQPAQLSKITVLSRVWDRAARKGTRTAMRLPYPRHSLSMWLATFRA